MVLNLPQHELVTISVMKDSRQLNWLLMLLGIDQNSASLNLVITEKILTVDLSSMI